jgi:membrane protein DedA with SNARE-associated domain
MSQLSIIEHPLGIWAYLAIAALVMIEGPIATLVGSVAASAGYLKPGWVFVSAAAGNMTADLLWYSIGYLSNIEWVVQYGRYVGLRREQVEKVRKEIHDRTLQIVFLGKLTSGFMIPVLIATGLARIPIRRWFAGLFAGECIVTGALVVLGFRYGRYVLTLECGLQIFALAGGLLFIVLIIRVISKQRAQSAEVNG